MITSRRRIASIATCLLLLSKTPLLSASGRLASPQTTATVRLDYAYALAAANRFLEAWQTRDLESGTVLLTEHAKQKLSHDELEAYFSTPAPAAYEIVRGRMLRPRRYSFPVVLISPASKGHGVTRRFSNIVVLDTGSNDWAVDKLPQFRVP
jgi:hypothetical protein